MGWYIVRTEPHYENDAKEFLQKLSVADGGAECCVADDVYLPTRRMTYERNGRRTVVMRPTIGGMLFLKARPETLERCVTDSGAIISISEGKLLNSRVYLYSNPTLNISGKRGRIAGAAVPDNELDMFRFYNERLKDHIEELRVMEGNYEAAFELDKTKVVQVVNGPYLGLIGNLKQMTVNSRRDHRLVIKLGNMRIVIPSVRSYRHVIVRDEQAGSKAGEVRLWKGIDRIEGILQSYGFADTAHFWLRRIIKVLRELPGHSIQGLESIVDAMRLSQSTQEASVKWKDNDAYGRCARLLAGSDSVVASLHACISGMKADETGVLLSLSEYFAFGSDALDKQLADIIKDIRLRPFLTPTSGVDIPRGRDYAVIRHENFIEVVLKVSLASCFRDYMRMLSADERRIASQARAGDDSNIYFAHLALCPRTDGTLLAITSWGGFFDEYTSRRSAGEDVEALFEKEYTRFCSLLSKDNGIEFLPLPFDAHGGGFATVINVPYSSVSDTVLPESLIAALRPFVKEISCAAVQIWQCPRLLMWRRLLQQGVFLR